MSTVTLVLREVFIVFISFSRRSVSSKEDKIVKFPFERYFKQVHKKILLKSFHLNGHTIRFHPQSQKLESFKSQHNWLWEWKGREGTYDVQGKTDKSADGYTHHQTCWEGSFPPLLSPHLNTGGSNLSSPGWPTKVQHWKRVWREASKCLRELFGNVLEHEFLKSCIFLPSYFWRRL